MKAESGRSSWFVPVALCVLSAACSSCSEGRAAEPVPRPAGQTWLTAAQAKEAKLETEPVQQRVLANTIAMTGKLTFSDLEVAHVFSPVTGLFTSITAALGQRMKKGDSLAVLESPDLDLALANLQKADADLVAAKHNFDRQKELATRTRCLSVISNLRRTTSTKRKRSSDAVGR